MKFADVKNDIAFRKIFGNENRKECLISFLNAILAFKEGDRVVDVHILDPYQLPKLRGGKVSIVDIKATDVKGRQFIVEMQVSEKDGFDKRVLYYTSKSYSGQIERADEYIKLKPTFFIGILAFNHTQNTHYISRSRVQDIDTGEVTIKDVEFNLIELEKFDKKEDELKTLTEKWVFFIKNADDLDVIPSNVDDNGLRSAYEEANQHTWTREEVDAYDYVYLREGDAIAERMAVEKNKTKEIAKSMKHDGASTSFISKHTGLSDEEIDNL